MGAPAFSWIFTVLDDEPLPELAHHAGCCRMLWAMVLYQALVDLRNHHTRDAVLRWLRRTSVRPGSFRWICGQLDLDPDRPRDQVLAQLHSPEVLERRRMMRVRGAGRGAAAADATRASQVTG